MVSVEWRKNQRIRADIFGCKPDDGHIRPKHVVYFILY